MNGRKQSSYRIFPVLAVAGLALSGIMARAQKEAAPVSTETHAGQIAGLSSVSHQLYERKPVAEKEHSRQAATQGLSSLPGTAQPAVSARLGQEDARYQMRKEGSAVSADNPAQSLSAEFTRRGMEVRASGASWSLALAGYGYGDQLESMPNATPQSRANRVEYRRGSMIEWYVNGPMGMEQGFTLNEPPLRHNDRDQGEPLTIALSIGGDLSASIDSPSKNSSAAGAKGLTLRDRSGQPVLRYSGLTARDASGQELAAWLELKGEQLALKVDDAKARYPVVVDPFVQQAKLTSSDGAAGDEFGVATAISSDGSTIVIGADGATVGSNSFEGAIYVFVKSSSGWTNATQSAKLTASDGVADTLFGAAVAMSADGSAIVAGSIGATIGPNSGQGAAYVFVKPSTGWTSGTETAKLTASDGAAHDVFGTSVGISSDGSTIGVGAIGASIPSIDQGAAYVFLRPASGWASETQAAKLTASDGAFNDGLGDSIALSSDGSVIVSGAPAPLSTGKAYVYVRPPSGWLSETETAKLTASDTTTGDVFGVFADISDDGSTIVVGALQAMDGSTFHQGAAYVFVEPAGGWATATQTAKLTASDGAQSDKLGSARISRDGNTIVAGAGRATVGSNLLQGAAYVFTKLSTGWASETQSGKLTASDGAASDFFGNSASISGDGSTIVVAALRATIGSNSGQGAAYVFLPAPLANLSTNGLSFGNQAVGTTSGAQTVTLTNTGNAPLHVTGVAATSGFSTTTNCITASPLAMGGTCTESVGFIPAAVGALNGNLTFTDDSGGAAGNKQSVSLSGTGVKASTTTNIMTVMPSPSVVGEPVSVHFSVVPQPGEILMPSGNVTVSASTGESCVGSAASGSCMLTFGTAGARIVGASYSGDANFLGSSSTGVTQTVQDFTLAASPASETISPGHSAIYKLTLTALDEFSGSVSLACKGAPLNSTCIITPNAVNLNGTAVNATVTVSSKNHGTFSLTFTGTFGSGNPATGGLTRTTSVSVTVK